jgi:N-dimethylarginine dimethylaminohydrolase
LPTTCGVTGTSAAYNAEGNRQIEPVVRRSAGDIDLEVHTIYLSTDRFVDRESGRSAHLTNAICPLDINKVLLYPSAVDAGTHEWLKRKGYKAVEVDREEQILYTPTNTIPLQPGAVFMVKGSQASRRCGARGGRRGDRGAQRRVQPHRRRIALPDAARAARPGPAQERIGGRSTT